MPRIARVIVVDQPHHITQRGNYGQDVFLDDSDREKYLSFLNEYRKKYKLSILAYCLMTNHIHFIVIPHTEEALSKVFNTTHMRYSQYFNKKVKEKGHLWQGRFYSCALDNVHLMEAVRYVERNPVRARMVKQPYQWKWSSALEHVGKQSEDVLGVGQFLNYAGIDESEWLNYLAEREDEKVIVDLKKSTLTGRPLGEESFIAELEKKTGRRLRALPWGRPKKIKNSRCPYLLLFTHIGESGVARWSRIVATTWFLCVNRFFTFRLDWFFGSCLVKVK